MKSSTMSLAEILNLMSPQQQAIVNLRTNTLSVVLGVKNAAGSLLMSAIRRGYTIIEMMNGPEPSPDVCLGTVGSVSAPSNKDDRDAPMDRFDSPEPDKYFVYAPPTVDMEDWEVESHDILYPDRPSETFIISGPLGEACYIGRRYSTTGAAEIGCRRRYGRRFIRMLPEVGQGSVEPDRWGALVRKP